MSLSLSRLRLSIVSGTGNAAPLLMSQIRSTTVTTQDLLNPCLKMDKTSYWYLTVLLFFNFFIFHYSGLLTSSCRKNEKMAAMWMLDNWFVDGFIS